MTRAVRRLTPSCDRLESRSLMGGTPPTDIEQLFLERLNDARANPAAYGPTIGLDLKKVRRAQPLALNAILQGSAREHSQGKADGGYNGPPFDKRIKKAGFPATYTGECFIGEDRQVLNGSVRSNEQVEQFVTSTIAYAMNITKGGNPIYRKQLLAITDTPDKPRRQAGIGVGSSESDFDQRFHIRSTYVTFTTAADADPRAFVTGVAYKDANANGRYDLGEGLGGVNVSVSRAGGTSTYSTGGYNLRLKPGVYTVTATGEALSAPIVSTVKLGRQNVRLDFVVR